MPCFANGNLLTEVLPLCGCLTSLKASGSPGLQVGSVVGVHACEVDVRKIDVFQRLVV